MTQRIKYTLKGKLKKLLVLLQNPRKIIPGLARRGLLNWVPDHRMISLNYKCITGYKLNLLDPRDYNEKLQWLKLHDRKPVYKIFVDKFEVRKYVEGLLGESCLIPLLGVFDYVDEISWDDLPNQFVIKCTHGTGCNIICTDKSKLNVEESRKKLRQWLSKNYFWHHREWPYRDIKPRLIIEEYMTDETEDQLKDYKIFCFDGKAEAIQVDYNRFIDHKRNLYSTNWDFLDLTIKYPNDSQYKIDRPTQLEWMISSAEKLASGVPHLRVDFYSIRDKAYFGEMTLYQGGGTEEFKPKEISELWGSYIKLVDSNLIRGSHD